MRVTRRNVLSAGAAVVAAGILPSGRSSAQTADVVAGADALPNKTFRMIVPFNAGGAVDINDRVLATSMGKYLNRTIIIENRPGGVGIPAVQTTMASPPDGSTIMHVSSSNAIQSALPKPPYDIRKDLAPLGMQSEGYLALHISGKLAKKGVKSVKDFVDYAKAHPGEVTFASIGPGSSTHLAAELFALQAGFKFVHVPYRATAVQPVLAGDVDAAFNQIGPVKEVAGTGDTVILAISDNKRDPAEPDIPTIAESGYPKYRVTFWAAFMTVKDTPKSVVDTLSAAYLAAQKDPEMIEIQRKLGGTVNIAGTPEAMARQLETDVAMWSEVIREAKLEIQ